MLTSGLCTNLCMGECTPRTPRKGKVRAREEDAYYTCWRKTKKPGVPQGTAWKDAPEGSSGTGTLEVTKAAY